jgi:hypothetical protein
MYEWMTLLPFWLSAYKTFSWVPKAMQVIGRGFRIERERERRDSQAKKGMRAMAGVAPNGNK